MFNVFHMGVAALQLLWQVSYMSNGHIMLYLSKYLSNTIILAFMPSKQAITGQWCSKVKFKVQD